MPPVTSLDDDGMTSILVLSASRHGATAEIAQAIADELAARGLEVTNARVDEVPPFPTDFDGFVLGSAVYAGHWVSELRHFVDEHRTLLSARPVWLFSSGPLGDMTDGVEEPGEVHRFAEELGAKGHKVFEGRLDRDDLNLVERAAVRFVHAPYGDFRDWEDIRTWADEIAAAFQPAA